MGSEMSREDESTALLKTLVSTDTLEEFELSSMFEKPLPPETGDKARVIDSEELELSLPSRMCDTSNESSLVDVSTVGASPDCAVRDVECAQPSLKVVLGDQKSESEQKMSAAIPDQTVVFDKCREVRLTPVLVANKGTEAKMSEYSQKAVFRSAHLLCFGTEQCLMHALIANTHHRKRKSFVFIRQVISVCGNG